MAGRHPQCELLLSVKHVGASFSLHQRRAENEIRFLWAEGVKGADIHARLCTQYGDNALPRRSVYEWIEMFKNGRTSVMDAERSGCIIVNVHRFLSAVCSCVAMYAVRVSLCDLQ
jgi:hypothetical protein